MKTVRFSPIDEAIEIRTNNTVLKAILSQELDVLMACGGKGLCATCHVGTSFTDSRYHNLGIGWDPANEGFADEGRFAITGEDVDLGAFKTPGLRETHLHPPYMHDGSLATLEDVVDHYVQGGTPNPWLSPKMKPLDLDEAEQAALVAFMEALAGAGWQDTPPALFPR